MRRKKINNIIKERKQTNTYTHARTQNIKLSDIIDNAGKNIDTKQSGTIILVGYFYALLLL